MPVTIEHEWVVTGANHPDEHPYYCPLICDTFAEARAQWHQLVHSPAPSGFAAQMSAMAGRIPESDAVFWYRLRAIAESSWRLVEQDSDPASLLRLARAELARSPIEKRGHHPGTLPPPDQEQIETSCRISWCVAATGADPNDPRTWADPVESSGLTSLKKAQDLYYSMARDLKGAPGLELPTTNISFWQSLQVTATTQWVPETMTLDDSPLIEALTKASSQPPQ